MVWYAYPLPSLQFLTLPLNGAAFFTASLKKPFSHVDTLDRMIRITLMDGSSKEIPRENVRELFPLPILFASRHLKPPTTAVFSRFGKAFPVEGQLPNPEQISAENKPMLLLCEDRAYVISQLPVFLEDLQNNVININKTSPNKNQPIVSEEEELAKEIEALEKILKESA